MNLRKCKHICLCMCVCIYALLYGSYLIKSKYMYIPIKVYFCNSSYNWQDFFWYRQMSFRHILPLYR